MVSSALFFCLALLVFLLTRLFDSNGLVLHLFSCFWAQVYFYCNPFWRLRVTGRENIPWRGPAVLVANHQSLGDILVVFGLYRPFKWVSKSSVFNLPLIGWNMRLNRYMALVRGDKASITRVMAQCRGWLDKGVPVLFFPEGTRSVNGEVQTFKDGAFRLAIEKGCPVIPIVLLGTSDTLPKHGMVLDTRANCTVEVLKPVDVRSFGDDVIKLRDHVRELIVERVKSGSSLGN